MVETGIAQLQAALDLFASEKQSVSFTDCIVMSVADHLHTKVIFSFDEIFTQRGYRLPSVREQAA